MESVATEVTTAPVDGHEYGSEKVPPSARNYGFADTFFLWFGGGVNTGTWWMGGILATFGFALGMRYTWLLVPAVTLPWAVLGYIAYKHGANTSVMTRASLGVRGARFQALVQTVIMAGWCSVNTFLAAISCTFILNSLFGWAAYGSKGSAGAMVFSIALIGVLQGLFAIAGHKVIKYMEWVSGILLIILSVYMTYVIIHHFSWSALVHWHNAKPPYASVATLIDLMVGFTWTWTQIGDFGRYAKSARTSTLSPWLGINIGQGWFFLVGMIGVIGVAIQSGTVDLNNSDPSTVMSQLGLGWMAFVIIIFASVNTNAMNIYTSAVALVNMVDAKIKTRTSLIIVSVLQLLLCFVPLLFPSFLNFFENFLNACGGLLAPFWTLVLVDYFIARKMRMNDEIFNTAERSTFWYKGGFNVAGMISFVLGSVVFYVFTYGAPSIASAVSATIPSVVVTGVCYLILVGAGVTRVTKGDLEYTSNQVVS